MKKILLALVVAAAMTLFVSCDLDDGDSSSSGPDYADTWISYAGTTTLTLKEKSFEMETSTKTVEGDLSVDEAAGTMTFTPTSMTVNGQTMNDPSATDKYVSHTL